MIVWYLKEQLCYVNRNICFSVKMDIFFESVHQHHAVQNMKHAYFSTLDWQHSLFPIMDCLISFRHHYSANSSCKSNL